MNSLAQDKCVKNAVILAAVPLPVKSPIRSDENLDLLTLPSREELGATAAAPEPLSKGEERILLKSQAALKKALAEIDYRLNNKLEDLSSREELIKSLVKVKIPYGIPRPSDDDLALTGGGSLAFAGMSAAAITAFLSAGSLNLPDRFILSGILGIVGGFFSLLALSSRTAEKEICVPAGSFLYKPVRGAIEGISWFFHHTKAAKYERIRFKEHFFQNDGSPPADFLSKASSLRLKLRKLFYKGPSSEAARDFDREVSSIEKSAIDPALARQRGTIAREALELAKEQIQMELSIVDSKLHNFSEARQLLANEKRTVDTSRENAKRRAELVKLKAENIKEASGMLDSLLEKLSVPQGAGGELLKAVAVKSSAMLKTLNSFYADRNTPIPADQSPVKHFANIISWLENNGAEEPVKDQFFSKFKLALHERLDKACKSAGGVIPGVND